MVWFGGVPKRKRVFVYAKQHIAWPPNALTISHCVKQIPQGGFSKLFSFFSGRGGSLPIYSIVDVLRRTVSDMAEIQSVMLVFMRVQCLEAVCYATSLGHRLAVHGKAELDFSL
jgi:hypothetical protein